MRLINFGTYLLAALFAASALPIYSEEPASNSSDSSQYKTVPVVVGGQKVPIRVMDPDPYAHMKSTAGPADGKYRPDTFSFNTTSSMAGKSFDSPTLSLTRSDSDFVSPEKNSFITKTYSDHAMTPASGYDSKSRFASTSAYSRRVTGLDKSYDAVASTDPDLGRSATLPASSTREDQDHMATLGDSDQDNMLVANSMSDKQYLGPGAQHVPDGINIKENIIISHADGLPARPLSIDEVRELINHGTKPNTDQKPPEPSKALNDPDYKPRPLRDNPSPGTDDDKSDPVPAPGTMGTPAAPESTEPLPQR